MIVEFVFCSHELVIFALIVLLYFIFNKLIRLRRVLHFLALPSFFVLTFPLFLFPIFGCFLSLLLFSYFFPRFLTANRVLCTTFWLPLPSHTGPSLPSVLFIMIPDCDDSVMPDPPDQSPAPSVFPEPVTGRNSLGPIWDRNFLIYYNE